MLGVALTTLWAAAFLLVLFGYRPGGPVDLAVGIGAILLLVPSLNGLITQLEGRGPQTLLPSIEAGYPWLLALVATGLFAGLGLARRRLGETAVRRRRLVIGSAMGAGLVVLTGSAFGAAALVNELALADRPAIGSRFGPSDPAMEVPECSGDLTAGETARLVLQMDTSIDDRRTGQLRIEGIRTGPDFRYAGYVASPLG